jgi:hypothetical protein
MKNVTALLIILNSLSFYSQKDSTYKKNQVSINVVDIALSTTSLSYERYLNKNISIKIPLKLSINRENGVQYYSYGLDSYYHFNSLKKTNFLAGVSLRREMVSYETSHYHSSENDDEYFIPTGAIIDENNRVYTGPSSANYSYTYKNNAIINIGLENRINNKLLISLISGIGIAKEDRSIHLLQSFNGEINISYLF